MIEKGRVEVFDLIAAILPLILIIVGALATVGKKTHLLVETKQKIEDKVAYVESKISQTRQNGNSTRKSEDMNVPRKAMTSEERYMESLRTLHKSGLLTKEELRDMLERHDRNNSRRSR